MYIKRMNEAYAREIMQWKYEAPYELYNLEGDEEELEELLHYFCVFKEDELIGFFCTGGFAQIHSGHEAGVYPDMNKLIDIGLGIKPEWTGQGFGREFLTFTLQYLQKQQQPKAFRLTVAGFNKRAIKLYKHLGFQAVTLFKANDMPFLIMIKLVGPDSD
ncbi:GNAT family N-acetyltransferase [Bacillus sp. SD088]|uniref:GNAT family N-acetyltransferase n=1 Tax=Bacillus sp. SD088 TaxID=2782012 RepID=UPI001DA32A2A|nr:GNAT family N-acetyltransferase [Bacillus sp. SD088]MBO0992909.1 GNAT family N-acetyltransferase [Bacillus sp. SD088]